ncbi:hypothetical protein ACIRU2_21020 [Streptomyces sp. NPDC101169]|uniref:hypothetical protein n=1 Tax=Streptomyces sp. NPDC101169 TaxID=3366121 RepID=UPI0037FA89A2
MPVTTRAVWAGRFQPFHMGHLHTLQRMASMRHPLVVAVIAADDTEGRGAFGKMAAAAGASGSNPLTVWERTEMISLALAAEPWARSVRTIGAPRPDLDWSLTTSFYPRPRVIYVTDRDQFEAAKLSRYRSLEEKVVVVGVTDLPEMSATEVRRRIAAGEDWQSLMHPATIDYFKEIDGPARFGGAGADGSGGEGGE